MKKIFQLFWLACSFFIFSAATNSFAQNTDAISGNTNAVAATTNTVSTATNAAARNTAIVPVSRGPSWEKRHQGFLAEAKTNKIDLLFLGDSITDFWRNRGSNVWNHYYAPLHAANFGISADRTQHVLWRIDHGELDGIKPKVVVLMIGTNNTGKERDGKPRNTVPEAIEGVQAVVAAIRAKLPDSKILLLGVFPRGATLDDPQRAQVALINTVISKLNDGKMIQYLDIGSCFLDDKGVLSTKVMPDHLHPNEHGYQIWADAMNPTLFKMMGRKKFLGIF